MSSASPTGATSDPTSDAIVEAVAGLRGGAKRRATADPLRAWAPYYAGYSLEFAEAVLQAASLKKGSVVLDPWNGSGTTTLAAAKNGLRSLGVDLNPFAVLVARARHVGALDARGARGLVGEISMGEPISARTNDDPLRAWLSASEVAEVRRIQDQVLTKLASPEGHALRVDDARFPPHAAFLLLALVRAARSRVRAKEVSNPTVFRGSPPAWRPGAAKRLALAWQRLATQMGDDLESTVPAHEPVIRLGDARRLPARRETIDFVLTSPPYCTRLDYAESTRFELALVAPERSASFQEFRRELMGAPLVRSPAKPTIPKSWPASVRELLERIGRHGSKASESYYFKTYYQYFADADAAVAEIAASLKPAGRAALVVQGSYYKEIKVDLPALYGDIAQRHGLNLCTLHRMPVRTVLATIHPGTQKYRSNWSYDESLVLLQKGSTP